MATSTPDIGTVHLPDGYQPISGSSTVRCSIGGAQIKAEIVILEITDKGMCGAVGGAIVGRLSINNHLILENQSFNYYCLNHDSYYKIEITEKQDSPHITGCHATWDWGTGYNETYCDDASVKPDS